MIVSHFEYQYGVGVEYKALEMLELARARDMRLDSGYVRLVFFHRLGLFARDHATASSCATCGHHGRAHRPRADHGRSTRYLAQRTRTAVVINTGSEEAVYTFRAPDDGFHRHGAATPPAEGATRPPRAASRLSAKWSDRAARPGLGAGDCLTLPPRADDGLRRKEALRAGMDADLLIFDPKRFATARVSQSAARDAAPTFVLSSIQRNRRRKQPRNRRDGR